MSENILTQIQSQYSYFTKVEKRIADVILKDPQKFITYSTATVAKLAGVSQGSINNFSRKFGNDGFSFLKLKIAHCVSKQDNYLEELPNGSRKNEVLFNMERKIRQDISALCHTLEINNDTSLKNAIQILVDANRIEIFGMYQSGIVAQLLGFKLIELGMSANFFCDSILFSVSAATLCSKDAIVVISATGENAQVLEAVNIAKENNVKIICFTANKFSTLAKLSDVVLLTSAGNGKPDGKTDRMRMSQLLLVDTICRYIEWKSAEKTKTKEKTDKILSSYKEND